MTIIVKGDELFADFSGTSDQVRAALNCTLACTEAAVYLAVKSLIDPDVPNNQGFMRPIHVTAPLGCILNSVWPAATGARGLTVFRTVDAVLGALAGPLPDRVFAAGEGGNSNIRMGGHDLDGNTFLMVDIIVGAWGGRPDRDGIDGIANIATNLSNVPAELLEAEFPVRVEEYGFLPDTGGPGRYRGGLAIVRQIRFLGHDATLQLRSDRRKFQPYGLQGGKSGTPSINLLNAGQPHERVLPSKAVLPITNGDVIRHETAGAGGHGDPLRRNPQRVLTDVVDGKESLEHAFAAYGVVIDPESFFVDESATAAARAERRQRDAS
ncbi:MAG: hydantoinase B/oxoprolinase family protein [Betaproteobacteria bacterium]